MPRTLNIFEGSVEGIMANLLNFDSDRKLEFDSNRPLEFDIRRPLDFDSRRALEFQPNRDLGFGRRGVVFRGYVCPVCGSLTTADATRCTECGTVFEGTPRAAAPTSPSSPAIDDRQKPPAPKAGKGGPPGTGFCAFCGVKLKRADVFCWNCGARATGSSEVVKLPGSKSQPVTRPWKR